MNYVNQYINGVLLGLGVITAAALVQAIFHVGFFR